MNVRFVFALALTACAVSSALVPGARAQDALHPLEQSGYVMLDGKRMIIASQAGEVISLTARGREGGSTSFEFAPHALARVEATPAVGTLRQRIASGTPLELTLRAGEHTLRVPATSCRRTRGCHAPDYQCREFKHVQCSANVDADASNALIAALRTAGQLEAGFAGFGPEHPDQCCATMPVVDEDQVREKEAFQREQWDLYVAQARAEKEARNEESRARAAAKKWKA